MALDFPSPATLNQAYQGPNGVIWTYDGAKWISGTAAHDNAYVPSDAPPLMDGVTSPGTAIPYSRGDHQHPSDTSRVYKGGDTMTGALLLAGADTNDPLHVRNTAGNYARARYMVAGQQEWSCGAGPDGAFNISNETVGIAAISVTSGAGAIGFTGPANFTSGASFGGGVTATVLLANQGNVQINKGSATNPGIFLSEGADGSNNRMVLYFEVATGRDYMLDLFSGACIFLDPGGFFHYQGGNGSAFKTGGGPWLDSSDARIKTVQGEYTGGLDAVLALRPVRFTYKGNDTATALLDRLDPDGKVAERAENAGPYPASSHHQAARDGKVFVGLVAQEAELALPGMVTQREGFIDGKPVTDLRDLDTGELIYALVNSVKELKAELDALKAARR